MSDYESFSDDSDKEEEDEEEELTATIVVKKKEKGKPLINIDTYNDGGDDFAEDVEEDEMDMEIDGDDYEDDGTEIKKGGAKKKEKLNDEDGYGDDDLDDDNLEEDYNENQDYSATKNVLISHPPEINYEDSDEDEDDNDDNYLQKFDSEISKNYVNDFHPECYHQNYDEIQNLTVIIRDDSNVIIDPFHKTIPYLTKYEKARVLGQRAKQIECGALPFVRIPENLIEPHIIAELELVQKKIPFIIRRPIPNGSFEYWNLKDLEIITY